MTTREYPNGLDCVWLAVDRNGNLGAFVTGGAGPIPLSALSDSSFPIEGIEEALCELTEVTEIQLLVQIKRPDSFIDLARRGFFVYDWRDIHRTERESTKAYELVALPLNPTKVDGLPETIQKLAVVTTLPNVAFIDERALDVTVIVECHSAD